MPSPEVDILVATRDEAGQIVGKLRNLAALDYPTDRLRIIVVDGGSSDDTAGICRAAAAAVGRRVEVVEAASGKTAQLQAGLACGRAPWILVSDADARLAPGALREMLAAARPGTGVVSAPVAVASTYVPEQIHWSLSNALRRFEDRWVGSAGLAVGPCYLVRRSLMSNLSARVIVDDVHAVNRATAAGFAVRLAGPPVRDLRSAHSLPQFILHKHRKAMGYVHEIARACPDVIGVRGPAARTFWLRLVIMAALPMVAVGMVLAAAAAFASAPEATIAMTALLAAPALGLRLPDRLRPIGLPSWTVLTGLILLSALAAWPFSALDSTYPRQGSLNQSGEPDIAS